MAVLTEQSGIHENLTMQCQYLQKQHDNYYRTGDLEQYTLKHNPVSSFRIRKINEFDQTNQPNH